MAQGPCIIDVEASGFGAGSYPIEVGFVLPGGRGQCTLICPEPEWTHWDDGAAQLHGITRDAALQHGQPVAEVARMLNQALTGRTVYTDAWSHDYSWLNLLFETAGLTQRFKLEHLRALLDDAQLERLDQAKREARVALQVQRHRASGDARVLQWAVVKVRNG
ncbi:MAG: hypothetical protein IPP44_20135 [Ideonella sp.]|nr:hypothetical protein [Ideonella sp.]